MHYILMSIEIFVVYDLRHDQIFESLLAVSNNNMPYFG